jgi:hypothetical protein
VSPSLFGPRRKPASSLEQIYGLQTEIRQADSPPNILNDEWGETGPWRIHDLAKKVRTEIERLQPYKQRGMPPASNHFGCFIRSIETSIARQVVSVGARRHRLAEHFASTVLASRLASGRLASITASSKPASRRRILDGSRC